MLVNLLFLGIIISGSVFCSAKYNKRFEEILPITCMGIGMLLFLFGIVGFLEAGSFVVIAVAVLLYLLTLVEFLKNKKSVPIFIKNFFSPGFSFFCLVTVILSFALYNQLASSWDEFSHWTDIVKVMTTLDDFGTNPESFSAFKSYPPAMTLFQYMFQKIYLFVKQDQGFNEWRIYLAYQLYFIAILLPYFRKVKYRESIRFLSLAAIILLVPLVFYNNIYCEVYIDPFLAILAGAGFSMVMLYEKEDKDIFYSIYIWLAIATLVLTKDAGIIFAIFLVIFYMADYCLNHQIFEKKIINKSLINHLVVSLLVIAIPKMLWKWKLAITQVAINFETHIDAKVLFNALIGRDDSYRSEVLGNYIYALFEQYITIGYTNIQINYFMLLVIMVVLLYIVLRFFVSKNRISKKQAAVYGVIPSVQLVAFILGMCVIYMFNFSEYEALNLASFGRYLNIAFLATGLIIFLLVWKIIPETSEKNQKIYGLVLISFIMLISPLKEGVDLLNRSNYEEASTWRAGYDALTNKIMNTCDGNDSVYVIAQGDSGIDRWVLKYNIRPNRVNSAGWSIGESFYEGDIWTVEKTADEWREELIEGYDYVALCWINDYFSENFSELFDDPSTIVEDGLYKVDKKSGMLYWVN